MWEIVGNFTDSSSVSGSTSEIPGFLSGEIEALVARVEDCWVSRSSFRAVDHSCLVSELSGLGFKSLEFPGLV